LFRLFNTLYKGGSNNNVYICGTNSSFTFTSPNLISNLSNIIDVSAGLYGNSLVLNSSGNVFSFGYNQHGQLGLNNNINTVHPTLVNGVYNIKKIITGSSSFIIDKNNQIYGSGANYVKIF
jgi:alpha-tubulin suppressor-like RCC1 family protein